MSDEWYNLGYADYLSGMQPFYNKEYNYNEDYMTGYNDAEKEAGVWDDE